MENATTVALSRLVAQERAMEVIAGNIANASSPGYKAEPMLFGDWLSRQRGTDTPEGGAVIFYAQDRATWRDPREGPLNHTGNPFDLAITGGGFFTVATPAGPRLTRNGRFGLLPDGTVADSDGNALLDTSNRPVQLGTADTVISIAGDGTISSENGQLGTIALVQVDDPLQLQAEGSQRFRATSAMRPVDKPHVVQGAVEDSNVQPILETTRMMTALREFQFAAEFVQAEADRQSGAIDKLTRRG
jgi:flagellar basal-body rod protein FlgF